MDTKTIERMSLEQFQNMLKEHGLPVPNITAGKFDQYTVAQKAKLLTAIGVSWQK